MIPTDRVSIEEIPEEKQPVEELVQEAFQQRPELEQAVLTLRNDEITLKGARNALLPTLDIYGYLGGTGRRRHHQPELQLQFLSRHRTCTNGIEPPAYGTAASRTPSTTRLRTRASASTLTIPIGNNFAQSVQARSLMEYRQAELRLEQLYTQIRMQVVNAQFALTNDRAQVQASIAARDLQPAEPGRGGEEAAAWALRPRPMCCCSSATWPQRRTT